MNRFFEQKPEHKPSQLEFAWGRFRPLRIYLVLAIISMLLALIAGWTDAAGAQEVLHPTQPQPVQVSTDVSKSVVQVAEPFGLDVNVTAPAGTKVFFPAVANQLGGFDVVEHQDVFDIPAATGMEQRSWKRHYLLESIVTGDLETPPIEIQFVNGANSDSIATKALPIRVVSVLEGRADPTQFRDIKSVVDVEVPKQKSNAWIYWTLGGMGAAGAFCLATVAVAARRKKYLTPGQWAISELEQLQTSPALQDADAEPVLREVSRILRGYLELQFEITASAQTTEEFLKLIEQDQIVRLHTTKRFAQLLLMADQAKFAGLQLTQSELKQVIESAIALVDSVTTEFIAEPDDNSHGNPTQPTNKSEDVK